MRRFLVLVLTLALGLTALAAAPAAAHSRDDDGDCRVVRTSEGPQCLTDEQIRQLRSDDRPELQRGPRDQGPHDHHKRFEDRRDSDRDHDWRFDRRRDRDQRYDRWWDWWFDYWNDRNVDSCDCLDAWETRRMERLADDPSPRNARRILVYLHEQGCLGDWEYRSLLRDVKDLDRSDLLAIIRDADRCDCDNGSHYWFGDRDIRWVDRWTGLDDRSIRRILGLRNDRNCVSRGDLTRLGRRIGDLGYWDDFDFLDWL